MAALVLLALASSASALPRVAKRDLVESWPSQLLLEGSLEKVPSREMELEQYEDDAPGMAAETTR